MPLSLRGCARLALTAIVLLGVLGCKGRSASAPFDAGRLGSTHLFAPSGPPTALVYVFSDESGWGPSYDQAAASLSEAGIAVVGVDLPTYLTGLAASDDGCHYLISEVEDFSQKLQRRFEFRGYRSPILAGIGAGGLLAYAALSQSPAATVAAAISVDPTDALATKVPLCPGAPASGSPNGFHYGPAPLPLHGDWYIDAEVRSPELQSLVDAAHGIARLTPGTPATRLTALVLATVKDGDSSGDHAGIAALPLIELPSEHPGGLLTIFFSGDGGWRDIDKQIGEVLAGRGAPVIGVDSLRYFWQAKSPEQVADDVARIVREYSQRWKAPKTVLIGYSFGAALLPFVVNRLPSDVRNSVVQVSLLGLEPRASFVIRVAGWFGSVPGKDKPEVLPEVMRMGITGLQCFYGEDEEETLCTHPELANADIIRTTGGHHFDGDYVSLARRILAGAKRRSGQRPMSSAGR